MKKKLVTGIVCVCMCFSCLSSVGAEEVVEASVQNTQSAEGGGISTRSEKIVWVIKEVNGKKYRRLFNTTTGEFIGDWIPC